MFETLNVGLGHSVKVGFLGIRSSDNADGVFHGGFFPAVEGLAEVGSSSKDFIDLHVFNIFLTIVISNRSSSSLGIVRK